MANETIEVRSSNIEEVLYDADTATLTVKFLNSDDKYIYDDVPAQVAEGFKYAASAGQYFRNNIKNRYRFYKS